MICKILKFNHKSDENGEQYQDEFSKLLETGKGSFN